MGYTTTFTGEIEITPPLNENEIAYLHDFANSRRMDRENGPFFVKGEGMMGQDNGPDKVHDYNKPPAGQPGLWCQWTPSDDGTTLAWDEGEKFYESAEWMQYVVHTFLADRPDPDTLVAMVKADPRLALFTFDHVCNGEIEAQGEDPFDVWMLVVKDNRCGTANGSITYGSVNWES